MVLRGLPRGLPRRRAQGPLLLRPPPGRLGARARRDARPGRLLAPPSAPTWATGGTVDGCEIVCPFHELEYDAEGANTDIPYSERVNRKARLMTYPTIERNGVVIAWYHPDGEARCGRCPRSPS